MKHFWFLSTSKTVAANIFVEIVSSEFFGEYKVQKPHDKASISFQNNHLLSKTAKMDSLWRQKPKSMNPCHSKSICCYILAEHKISCFLHWQHLSSCKKDKKQQNNLDSYCMVVTSDINIWKLLDTSEWQIQSVHLVLTYHLSSCGGSATSGLKLLSRRRPNSFFSGLKSPFLSRQHGESSSNTLPGIKQF